MIDIKSRIDVNNETATSQNGIESNVSGKLIALSPRNKSAEGYSVIGEENIDADKGNVSVKASLLTKENNKPEAIEKSEAVSTV